MQRAALSQKLGAEQQVGRAVLLTSSFHKNHWNSGLNNHHRLGVDVHDVLNTASTEPVLK